jgi:hypothetical protein
LIDAWFSCRIVVAGLICGLILSQSRRSVPPQPDAGHFGMVWSGCGSHYCIPQWTAPDVHYQQIFATPPGVYGQCYYCMVWLLIYWLIDVRAGSGKSRWNRQVRMHCLHISLLLSVIPVYLSAKLFGGF